MTVFHRSLVVLAVALLIFAIAPFLRRPLFRSMAERWSGRILTVHGSSEYWYVDPVDHRRYPFRTASDVFHLMQERGLGVRSTDIERYHTTIPKTLLGRIVLDAQTQGAAYYLSPTDRSIQALGTPQEAFVRLSSAAQSITAVELEKIPIGSFSSI